MSASNGEVTLELEDGGGSDRGGTEEVITQQEESAVRDRERPKGFVPGLSPRKLVQQKKERKIGYSKPDLLHCISTVKLVEPGQRCDTAIITSSRDDTNDRSLSPTLPGPLNHLKRGNMGVVSEDEDGISTVSGVKPVESRESIAKGTSVAKRPSAQRNSVASVVSGGGNRRRGRSAITLSDEVVGGAVNLVEPETEVIVAPSCRTATSDVQMAMSRSSSTSATMEMDRSVTSGNRRRGRSVIALSDSLVGGAVNLAEPKTEVIVAPSCRRSATGGSLSDARIDDARSGAATVTMDERISRCMNIIGDGSNMIPVPTGKTKDRKNGTRTADSGGGDNTRNTLLSLEQRQYEPRRENVLSSSRRSDHSAAAARGAEGGGRRKGPIASDAYEMDEATRLALRMSQHDAASTQSVEDDVQLALRLSKMNNSASSFYGDDDVAASPANKVKGRNQDDYLNSSLHFSSTNLSIDESAPLGDEELELALQMSKREATQEERELELAIKMSRQRSQRSRRRLMEEEEELQQLELAMELSHREETEASLREEEDRYLLELAIEMSEREDDDFLVNRADGNLLAKQMEALEQIRGNGRHDAPDLTGRNDLVRKGQQETEQALKDGRTHIVVCKECKNKLHAPVSYELVFCPNCNTISPTS